MTAKPRVALFIDAENASPTCVAICLEHCRNLGKPTIARCYGNQVALKRWEKAIASLHLIPMLTPASGGKANATDFALTIDVASLLHRNLFDHAVIVTSDADFTQLAMHIREHGRGIDGLGEAKTPTALRTAYDTFVEIPVEAKSRSARQKTTPAKSSEADASNNSPAFPHHKELRATFERLATTGKVTLATLGKAFREDHPGIPLVKGKLKKQLLALGMKVNERQEVSLS